MAGLIPWREVVEPHQDVATGEFQQAEFAADLAKVHNGSAPSEYRNPREFFARTYLTEGLSTLLIGAAKRLSGAAVTRWSNCRPISAAARPTRCWRSTTWWGVRRRMICRGWTSCCPRTGSPFPRRSAAPCWWALRAGRRISSAWKAAGKIRTTWGELAWQLGGAEVFAMIAENDARGVAPGSNLLEAIFKKCAPCLILIDEWVAYLRQIYKVEGLPSGSFDANLLSFVQALTEAVSASPGTLLVASLPASQIEVGGGEC